MTVACPALRSPSSISCVVPSLNEAENLLILLPALLAVLRPLAPQFEVIVVDDGSTDATVQVLQPLLQTHPELVLLELSRNFGKEAAMSAGLAMFLLKFYVNRIFHRTYRIQKVKELIIAMFNLNFRTLFISS